MIIGLYSSAALYSSVSDFHLIFLKGENALRIYKFDCRSLKLGGQYQNPHPHREICMSIILKKYILKNYKIKNKCNYYSSFFV